ncbi:Bcr/CflA family drug resistance efflux transporter [Staphylococcus agnetis]|nr:Bcr/CflA family drug resistance efflux transporter [Staphylococcus agnetis]PTH70538.1 Bcr/CflA family drug resistance efflux transporter [Staphylococcus agnetis]PTH76795.1 Bcr/CflA family drug resistance efflux transporter [Staphylococcus agnetis]
MSMENIEKKYTTMPLLFIILLGTMTAFGPLLSDMYSPALPLVQKDLMTSTSETQLTLSIAMIGIAIGQFMFGIMADRISRRTLAMVILCVLIAASLCIAISHSVYALLSLRFVQGLAGGGAIVIARAIAGETFKGAYLSRFFTALMVVNGLISILAPLANALLLSFGTWRYIFFALAGIGAILLLSVMVHPHMKTIQHSQTKAKKLSVVFKDFIQLIRTPSFVLPMLLQGVTYIMIFSYGAGAPFITQNVYGMTPQSFSLLMVLVGIGLILSSQVSNVCLRFMPQLRVLTLFIMIQVVGAILTIIVCAFHLPVAYLVVSLFITVTPVTAIGPIAFSLAMQMRTGGSGSASSLLGLVQFILGSSIAPLIGIQGPESVIPYCIVLGVTTILLLGLGHFTFHRLKHHIH